MRKINPEHEANTRVHIAALTTNLLWIKHPLYVNTGFLTSLLISWSRRVSNGIFYVRHTINMQEHNWNLKLASWQILNTQLSNDSLSFNVFVHLHCNFHEFTFLEVGHWYILGNFLLLLKKYITHVVLKSLFWFAQTMSWSFFMSSLLPLLLPTLASSICTCYTLTARTTVRLPQWGLKTLVTQVVQKFNELHSFQVNFPWGQGYLRLGLLALLTNSSQEEQSYLYSFPFASITNYYKPNDLQ